MNGDDSPAPTPAPSEPEPAPPPSGPPPDAAEAAAEADYRSEQEANAYFDKEEAAEAAAAEAASEAEYRWEQEANAYKEEAAAAEAASQQDQDRVTEYQKAQAQSAQSGIVGSLLALLLTFGGALSATAAVGAATDPPQSRALGVAPASAAAAAGGCSSGAGSLRPSKIILACQNFQGTQLPNVFPEVPPAVATPTPVPETPTPAPQESTSTSSQSSQSSHSATPPPPPPPPADCIPNTMSADGSTVSGSGNTRSSERVYVWNSGAVSGTVTFSISGLNLGSTCSPHYSLVARQTTPPSGPPDGNYGYSCGPSSSLSVNGTVAPSQTWTMWVDMQPGGCPSVTPH